ncbi:hypothetical protein CLV58_14229 [Spirosoma oryzae]|uniref:Uncharacterized protein n=2 Tax=Spirosoma oryzae TaxID=1469603 RepID=A0A2T0RQ62_9BACT|nr:hypothetical protein CLV58_14229 [Spirosoma oryzae]
MLGLLIRNILVEERRRKTVFLSPINKVCKVSLTSIAIGILTSGSLMGQLVNYSGDLPATDALGRRLPVSGGQKKGRYVGLFYWPWHYQYKIAKSKPINLSKFLQDNAKLLSDANARSSYDNSLWPTDGTYFWSEPLFGFYINTDKWVLRKHAEMLADAGVDVIFFDCTNGQEVWKPAYTALCEVFIQARKDGINAPKIAFMTALTPSDDGQNAINKLYAYLYEPGLYKELWFYWKGKPLLLGYPDLMTEIPSDPAGTQSQMDVKNFFTFRPVQPSYNAGASRPDQWGWLQIYPQHKFVKRAAGGFEEIPVGVAQNWSKERGLTAMNAPNVFGRSYTSNKGASKQVKASFYGLNFQEQWEWALRQNVELIFITGWNEWVVNRHREWGKEANAFPDAYNVEYSRDIEPMRGGHGDNYYYQMVANIRRFKGIPPVRSVSRRQTVRVDGAISDWATVLPEYRSHKGSTLHRDSPGFGPYRYINKSGRNDIINAKVARDEKYVYFLVKTANKLSPHTDDDWMTLYLDVDKNKATGWEGYDIVVNRKRTGKTALIEKSGKGKLWTKVTFVDYAYGDNHLELRIPRTLLENRSRLLDFEFKWADNCVKSGSVMDFWVNGDAAPAGRFNYHYSAK